MSSVTLEDVFDCCVDGNLNQLSENDLRSLNTNKLNQLFQSNLIKYQQSVDSILRSIDISLLQRPQLNTFIFEFLLQVPCPNTLIVLAGQLSAESIECFRREKLLNLLIKLLGNTKWMLELFQNGNRQHTVVKSVANTDSLQLSQLENILIHFPTRIANQFQLLIDPFFRPSNYYKHLIDILFKSLVKSLDSASPSIDFSVSICGRLCAVRQENSLWSNCIVKLSNSNNVAELFSRWQDLQLEPILQQMLSNATNVNQVIRFLGTPQTDRCERLRYLMTNKLLLQYVPESNFCATYTDNLIGYLAENHSWLMSAFEKALNVWACGSSVRRMTDRQHQHLCLLLVKALRQICPPTDSTSSSERDNKLNEKLLAKCTHGSTIYLTRTDCDKRYAGLFVLQLLINNLFPMINHSLNFDLPPDIECIRLLQNAWYGRVAIKSEETDGNSMSCQQTGGEKKDASKRNVTNVSEDDESESIQKYPHFSIQQIPTVFYLRDCLNGLMDPENPDLQSQCLQHAKSLMTANQLQTKEMSRDLCSALLYMQLEPNTDDCSYRKESLIRLTLLAPLSVSDYLIEQFYSRNLSLVNKSLVLEVIRESTKQLREDNDLVDTTDNRPVPEMLRCIVTDSSGSSQTTENWKQIVEERVRAKTRIFTALGKGCTRGGSRENRMLNVVGHFFFPLLNRFEQPNDHVSVRWDQDDYMLLVQLLITLADLLQSVRQMHVSQQMAGPFIRFLNRFSFHSEPNVIETILYCIRALVISVPDHFLFADMLHEMIQLRQYLITIKKDHPNLFQQHGPFVLFMLEKSLQQTKLND